MAVKLISLKDAAAYMKVSSNVIKEFIDSGVLTPHKGKGGPKINQYEIDEWVASLSENEKQKFALKKTVCRFRDYFGPENILQGIKCENKYEAIAHLCKFAKDLKIVRDNTWLYEVVVAREELVSTAVGNKVALLHPRHPHPGKIKRPVILFGRSVDGVDFDAPDDEYVDTFFLLLLLNDKQHLFALSYISKFLKDPANVERLRSETDPDNIVRMLTTEIMDKLK